MTSGLAPTPGHIPDELVIDFDCYAIPGAEADVQLAWRDAVLGTGKDVFWTPRNGGHWVFARAEDILNTMGDYERFSNRNYTIPATPRKARPLPLGVDPPDHRRYRALIAPAFSPKGVRQVSNEVRTVAIELVERLSPSGGCEFVSEFAKVLPIVVFLGLAGIPQDQRSIAVPMAERFIRASDLAERTAALDAIAAYMNGWIDARRHDPRDDLISTIVHAQVDGRPITEEEIYGLLILLFNGGLDTVASMLAYVFRFLAKNPDHRRQLLEDRALIPNAVEELLRRHGIVADAREVVADTEVRGVRLKAGDMVQLPTMMFGLSEETVERPLEVDFHRPAPIPIATFGHGPHKCPGANLARQEIRIALEEWLPRIPDFAIVPGTSVMPATGAVSVIRALHLQW